MSLTGRDAGRSATRIVNRAAVNRSLREAVMLIVRDRHVPSLWPGSDARNGPTLRGSLTTEVSSIARLPRQECAYPKLPRCGRPESG